VLQTVHSRVFAVLLSHTESPVPLARRFILVSRDPLVLSALRILLTTRSVYNVLTTNKLIVRAGTQT
jgi:hypothetical protein